MMEEIVEKANNHLGRFEIPEKNLNLDQHWQIYLRRSEEDGVQQVLSPPEPPVHMPASISLCKVSHIFGHFSETSSKSPNPSNSSHSIPSLAFLSADSTKDSKTILRCKATCFEGLNIQQISIILLWKSFQNWSQSLCERCNHSRWLTQLLQPSHKMMLKMVMLMMVMMVVTTFPQGAPRPLPCLGQRQRNAKAGSRAPGTLPDSLAYHRPCGSASFSLV